MAPRRAPEPPGTGAALSSTGTSAPLRETSRRCSVRVTMMRSRRARIRGWSMVSRVRSSIRGRTSSTAFFRAAFPVHPVSASATGLRNVIRPSLSVASTASPMPASVDASTRRFSRHAAVIQTITMRNRHKRSEPHALRPVPARLRKKEDEEPGCRGDGRNQPNGVPVIPGAQPHHQQERKKNVRLQVWPQQQGDQQGGGCQRQRNDTSIQRRSFEPVHED